MAKIKSVDQAIVITSTLTNEQLAKATKYFPEVLTIKAKNDEEKLVPVFTVSYGVADKGSANRYGISFPKGPKSDNASVTIVVDKMEKSKRVELIKDSYGKTLVNLNAIEEAYAKTDKEFDAQYKALENNIVVE